MTPQMFLGDLNTFFYYTVFFSFYYCKLASVFMQGFGSIMVPIKPFEFAKIWQGQVPCCLTLEDNLHFTLQTQIQIYGEMAWRQNGMV